MHAVGAAVVDGVEDRLGVEVALGCGLPAERVGLVGEAHVERVAIEFAVHRDGADSELAGGANDPDGDLSTVGDQDLGQHECQSCVDDHSRRHLADHRSSTKPAARTPICWPLPRPARADRTVLDGPPPDRWPGSARPSMGRARRAPTCWSRCCSAMCRRILTSSPSGSHWRPRRRAASRRGRADAEVAERSAARRIASSPACWPRQEAPGDGPQYVVVGIGLNVGWAPDGAARLGDGIRPGRRARRDCSPRTTGCRPTSPTLYRAALATIGQSVRVELPDRRSSGGRSMCWPTVAWSCSTSAASPTAFDTGDVVHLRSVRHRV